MILKTTAIIIESEGTPVSVRMAYADDIETGKTVYVPNPENEWEAGYVTHQDERGYILVDFDDDTREEYPHFSKLWVKSEHCILSVDDAKQMIETNRKTMHWQEMHVRLQKHLERHLQGIKAAKEAHSLLDQLELFELTCDDLTYFLEHNYKDYEPNKAKQKNLPRRQG